MKRTTLHAALALALLAPAAALAQHFETVDNIPWPTLGRFPAYPAEPPRPTEIYVHAGALRDNNIFRFADGVNRRNLLGNSDNPADEVLRVGGGIRHEFLVTGRQRLRLDASGDQYSYHRNTLLNHVNYALRGEWLWEFTNDAVLHPATGNPQTFLGGKVSWDGRWLMVLHTTSRVPQ